MEPKFKLSELRKNCELLFNVEPFIFDAATYGKQGEYTKQEIEDIIDAWKKKEAK